MRHARITSFGRFVGYRILQALPIAALVVVANFVLLKRAPGDLADVIAGQAGAATPEYMAKLRAAFGADEPLPMQFWHYVVKIAHFDLGWSFSLNASVGHLIALRIVPTAMLMGASLLIALVVGAGLGVAAAVTRHRWLERLISALAMLGFAIPGFWLALMMTVLFTVWLGWLPSGGMRDFAVRTEGAKQFLDLLRHLAMPVACLSFSYLALYVRLMRESVRDVALQPFMRTARAKGASRARLIWRHIVPNASLPIVTLTGLQFGALLSGSVTVETVFDWPGLGQLALQAVNMRDINLLLGVLLVSSLFVVLVNLLTELLSAWLDPRAHVSEG